MAVIWGLDLSEMQWGKFKGSYMFNQVYHLRRTKMIVYQIAMILCVVSESVGTAALSGWSLALREIKVMLIVIYSQTTSTSKMASQPAATGKPLFTITTSWASPPSISSSALP
jgi:hypothetical protein